MIRKMNKITSTDVWEPKLSYQTSKYWFMALKSWCKHLHHYSEPAELMTQMLHLCNTGGATVTLCDVSWSRWRAIRELFTFIQLSGTEGMKESTIFFFRLDLNLEPPSQKATDSSSRSAWALNASCSILRSDAAKKKVTRRIGESEQRSSE